MIEETNVETVVDIRQIFTLLRKNLISIVICGVAGIVLALIISFIFMTPKYSATIDLLVNQRTDNVAAQYNAQQADLQAINTYKDVLQKSVILTPVLKQIRREDNYSGNIGNLQNSISITNQTNSQVISVTVKDGNAFTAADIANTIGSVFSNKIKKMMKVDNVTVVNKAKANTSPISPNKKLNFLLGLIAGLVIGIAIVIIRDRLDTTVKDERFLTDDLGLTSLGAVGHMSKKTNRHAVSVITEADSIAMKRRRI